MNRREFIINFFIGGCVGKTLIEISGIIAKYFMEKNISDVLFQLENLILIFIVGGIGFNIAKTTINHIEKKDLKINDRQKLLRKQMYLMSGAIILFSVFVIIYLINNNYIGVIYALSFALVFSIWGYAFLLSYINLKNSLAMINKNKT